MQAHAYVEPKVRTFVQAFQKRGVVLWREGDALRYRAPAGVLTTAVLAKLKEAKEKILPALEQRFEPLLPQAEPQQVPTSPLPLAVANPFQDARQKLLEWALSESRRGLLPELTEPLALPSGNVVPADHAAAWLIAAESRRAGLAHHAEAFPDCALALEIVIADMVALASWAAVSARNEGRKTEMEMEN